MQKENQLQVNDGMAGAEHGLDTAIRLAGSCLPRAAGRLAAAGAGVLDWAQSRIAIPASSVSGELLAASGILHHMSLCLRCTGRTLQNLGDSWYPYGPAQEASTVYGTDEEMPTASNTSKNSN